MLQGLVETKILEKLNKRDECMNIIKMQAYFVYKEFLCIVFELLMQSLDDMVQVTDRGLPLD